MLKRKKKRRVTKLELINYVSFGIILAIIVYSLSKSDFFIEQKKNVNSKQPVIQFMKANLKISWKYLFPIAKFYFRYILEVTIYLLFFLWIYSAVGDFNVLAIFLLTIVIVRLSVLGRAVNKSAPKEVVVLSPEEHERIRKGLDSIEKYRKKV